MQTASFIEVQIELLAFLKLWNTSPFFQRSGKENYQPFRQFIGLLITH